MRVLVPSTGELRGNLALILFLVDDIIGGEGGVLSYIITRNKSPDQLLI